MSGFREIHSHFVYGIDDGAQTKADMEAMLDAAYENNVSVLFATPHAVPGIRPFDEKLFQEHLEEARQYCREKQYPIRICAGAEILYTPALNAYVIDNSLPTMENSRQVLVEFMPDVDYDELEEAVVRLKSSGYKPVLAHAERYGCLYRRNNLWRLKEKYDIGVQINCNSVLEGNRKGYFRKRRMDKWFRAELIDYVSSDAHDGKVRRIRIKEAYAMLAQKYGDAYAAYLTGKNG